MKKASDAQVTVLVLLIVLMGMELVRNGTTTGEIFSLQKMGDALMGGAWKKIILYFMGVLLLELLASVAPNFTIWFVVLLIVGVGVSNANVYAAWLSNATAALSPPKEKK